MVSYGPWIQYGAYEEWWAVSTFNSPPLYEEVTAAAEAETAFQDPPYAILGIDVAVVFETMKSALPNGAPGSVRISTDYELAQVGTEWRSHWRADGLHRRWNVSGYSPEWSPFQADEWDPSQADPAAIGIEYEGQPFDPENPYAITTPTITAQYLAAGTTLTGSFGDLRTGPGEALPWSSSTGIYIDDGEPLVEIPGHAFDTDGTSIEQTFTGPRVDITSFGTGTDFNSFFYTKTLAVNPGSLAPVDTGFTVYGWLLDRLQFDLALMPPRWRWVYDTTPIRQTFARDDHLAGGAYQTWPPPKSEQESNRTFGGYV